LWCSVVYINSGVYLISTNIELKSNVWLKGAGIDSTIIHCPTGAIKSTNNDNVRLSDFSISGKYGFRFVNSELHHNFYGGKCKSFLYAQVVGRLYQWFYFICTDTYLMLDL